MKSETKKKLEFLISLGLTQNEINEIMDSQNLLDKSQEFEKVNEEEEED